MSNLGGPHQDGAIYPVEIKKTAEPSKKDERNLGALDPLEADVPDELTSFKREVGLGCILCMAQDAYPISSRSWAFPIWAV